MAGKIPSDGVVVQNARRAVAAELRKKKILKQPIAKFDPKTGKVYLLHRDVTVNGCLKKPEVVAFAGPNGSGKSTITNLLRPTTAE